MVENVLFSTTKRSMGLLEVQWNLDLVTLLLTWKTVTKSRVVTKSIAHAYGVSINSKFSLDTKLTTISKYAGP